MDVSLEDLKRVHPIRDRNAAMWSDYRLLYQGGHEFKRAAGMQGWNIIRPETAWDKIGGFQNQRNRRFLFQWEGEPDPVYETLWQRSEYINYVAPICDYYTQWLFCTPPQIRPTEGKEAPAWFPEFTEDATGGGRNFVDFIKDSFLGVLQCQRGGWLIGRDHSVAAVSAEDDQVILTPYSAEEICDWQHDCTGELEWILLHKKVQYRDFPEQRKEEETYTFLNREMSQSWDVVKNGAAESLETEGEVYHDLGKVPFVELSVPPGMWILDKIAQPCIGLYNRWNRLKNAEALACVVQPYLVSAEGDTSRVIGEGPIMKLRPAMKDGGAGEDFGWKTPDVGPLDFISTQIEKARDEIYRIVHQMSLAVDSKAVGAIARSGASKIEDRRSSQILLTAYGSYVAPAMLRTITLLSLIYGDGTTWSIDGFKNFDISSLDEELTTAAMAQSLNLKSQTARKRIELRAVGRILDGEDETTMQVIEKETDAAYEMEGESQTVGGEEDSGGKDQIQSPDGESDDDIEDVDTNDGE
jgi:hypothetical protein